VETVENQKHSGIGIASFVISIISGTLILLLMGIAGMMEVSTPGGLDEESAGAVIIGLLLFAFVGGSLIALGLGIGGLIQKGKKKIFAILGTIFSSLTILVAVFVTFLGLAMG
jgi:hypothetical protein